MKHVLTVAKTSARRNGILADGTVRIGTVNIVLKGCHKLRLCRNHRHVIKGTRGNLPLCAQRNVHNIPLRLNGFQECTHEHENLVGHAIAVTNDTTANGLGECDGDTKKNHVCVDEVSDNTDDCE
jgi:hypothetical protein